MKIVFFGTPLFAATILERLAARYTISAVVTKPDQPVGRSSKPVSPAVKDVAERLSIPVYQPVKCSTEEFANRLRAIGADLFVVVAYGEIISQLILDIPVLGCINVHASLLPKYRGAAPIHRALMNGEQESGISIIKMVKKMDAGDILGMKKVSIGPNVTFSELERMLCDVGGTCLFEVIEQIAQNATHPIVQPDEGVTFAPRVTPEESQIFWDRPVDQVHNLIRGTSMHPGAWCMANINGNKKRLKILLSTIVDTEHCIVPGTVVQCNKNGFVVSCGRGLLRIVTVQLEGKPVMPAAEFVKGIVNSQIVLFNVSCRVEK